NPGRFNCSFSIILVWAEYVIVIDDIDVLTHAQNLCSACPTACSKRPMSMILNPAGEPASLCIQTEQS
ncbi:hypothetical protein, partial [Pseudomonas ficuserectae]|uniref:hypothetical protein n=1 Tax=Pseudomonas ficuserectae TaxID=53410 RepID=UPI001C3F393F